MRSGGMRAGEKCAGKLVTRSSGPRYTSIWNCQAKESDKNWFWRPLGMRDVVECTFPDLGPSQALLGRGKSESVDVCGPQWFVEVHLNGEGAIPDLGGRPLCSPQPPRWTAAPGLSRPIIWN
eukprot:2819378-Rhodomonas_salina.1